MAEKNREFLTVINKGRKTTYIYHVGIDIADKKVRSVEFGESKRYKEIIEGKELIGLFGGSNSKIYELVDKYIHWSQGLLWSNRTGKEPYTEIMGSSCIIRKYVDMHDASRIVYKIYDFQNPKLLFVGPLSSRQLYDIFFDNNAVKTFENLYNQ